MIDQRRTQKSLHNISRMNNNLSKSKLTSAPQVVISYNFENDNTNGQLVRTHNLLIGLEEIGQGRGYGGGNNSKSTFRKNVLGRGNYVSMSGGGKIISKQQSSSLLAKNNNKHQLLRVRSNDILLINNKNSYNSNTINSYNSNLR